MPANIANSLFVDPRVIFYILQIHYRPILHRCNECICQYTFLIHYEIFSVVENQVLFENVSKYSKYNHENVFDETYQKTSLDGAFATFFGFEYFQCCKKECSKNFVRWRVCYIFPNLKIILTK